MTLTFLQVRIGQLGVEASAAAIEGKAPGQFGAVGHRLDYEELFEQARAGGGAAVLPWSGKGLRGNRFWKKYVTNRLAKAGTEDWGGIAWQALVPLKVVQPLPAVRLDPGESRAYSEAFLWPTGFGICWNNWIEWPLDTSGLVGILNRLRNDEIDFADGGGPQRMGAFYHRIMDQVRETFWGNPTEGTRSELITVVTIIHAAADPAAADAASKALETLLDGIKTVWGERPRVLAGDRNAESGHTVYAAKGLRLVWLPDSFLATGRIHRAGCLHRNLLAATLQVELLAATAQLLADARPAGGSLPPGYAPFVQRVIERIGFFLSDRGYSAPFLSAQLERGPVRAARQTLERA